ncbi:MAG: cysteine desulfurase [Lachnospiraceae bacterium]|nr:cysteine desulfurase [Lachnospiraceae bacterium]
MNKNIIYLDNAATTRTDPRVVNEMLKYFDILYGNPSSVYEFAGKSKEAIEKSRHIIAKSINAKDTEIYFTSGGTESDNWALRGTAKAYKDRGRHIITSKIEHKAILNTAKNIEDIGFEVSYIDVNEYGVLKLQGLKDSIRNDTILISVMMANNEVGTIEPYENIADIAKMKNIIFHTDAVQCYGHIPINVKKSGIDLLSASAHKFNGPKGIGFLYISDDIKKEPMMFGGGQENGMRSGTQNVPSIVGMAMAARIAHENIEKRMKTEKYLRDYFIDRVLREIPFARLNGDKELRLPGNVNFSFEYVNNTELIALLDSVGICASGGSACSASKNSPSHVLVAMGLTKNLANSAIRFTFSHNNTKNEIDYTVNCLKYFINNIRKS